MNPGAGQRAAVSPCLLVETHPDKVGVGGGGGGGLTFEVSKLPLLHSVLIDCCREEIAAVQLLANGSIFCEKGSQR